MANTFLNSGLDVYVPDNPMDFRSVDFSAVFAGLDLASLVTGTIDSHANGPTYSGMLGDEGQGDVIAVNLIAGQTYTWSYRGTDEGGIEDPLLALFNSSGGFVTLDDDGGFGRAAQITYTAATSGVHYLLATSWYQVDPNAPAFEDEGDYTIVQWSPEAGHDAGNSIATAGTIDVGTNYEYYEVAGDSDYYSITLEAGNVYTFTNNGGVASNTPGAGESISAMTLYNSDGDRVTGFLYSSTGEVAITYLAETTGTYFLRSEPISNFFGGTPQTGGYTIDVSERPIEDFDPLESLNWDSAANVPSTDVDGVPTVYVYFAEAGETFGQLEVDGSGNPMATFGWQQHQIDAVMHALNNGYTPITGLHYEITTDSEQATFRLLTTQNLAFGARFFPQDPAYGDAAGIGVFNLRSGGFGTDPASLQPGGYSYGVILHEFGHAHGVAHPHDRGGGSEVMLGVGASDQLGLYDLNQGVYTVMSYNDGWVAHPDGERLYSPTTRGSGWSESLGAFDIAVLQARYGVHENNTGNDVYTLTDNQADATYITIWDSAGTDEIRYDGLLDTRIDLLAATLDYTPTGGGVVSFVHGVYGGYTIANSVVIENATGGEGNDVILGNEADNVLTGRQGDDVMMGRAGNDMLIGGNDSDELYGDEGNDSLLGGNAGDILFGGDGNDILEGGNGADVLNGGAGNDILIGGNGPDLFVFDAIGDGVDRVIGYSRSNDSIHVASDGIISWTNSSQGAQMFVDGELTAIFEGLSARQMANEVNTPMMALDLSNDIMYLGATGIMA